MISFVIRINLLNCNQIGFLAVPNTSDAPTEFLDKAFSPINQNRVLLLIS